MERETRATMEFNIQSWILLSLLAIMAHAFGDFKEINRLNYGVYMTKRKDITMTQASWKHTNVLQVPTLTDFGEIPLPDCDFELTCTDFCLSQTTALIPERHG